MFLIQTHLSFSYMSVTPVYTSHSREGGNPVQLNTPYSNTPVITVYVSHSCIC